MLSDLNMSNGKMSDFVTFPLFVFTVVIKHINFDFQGHSKTLIFFDKKMISDLIMSSQTVSYLVESSLFE